MFLVRSVLELHGRLRISSTGARVFYDLDPGPPEAPLIALDVIARSDADGLKRLILSALPHVDRIVVGVDSRSDEDTLTVARALADRCWCFEAEDVGMPDEEWSADKINFAGARNANRTFISRLRVPWCLTTDTDEYVRTAPTNLRELVRAAPSDVEGFQVRVDLGKGLLDPNGQRLASTRLRWQFATHNQLVYVSTPYPADVVIVHDPSIRDETETERRKAQRDVAVDDLAVEADKGNLVAHFHLTKHRLGQGDVARGLPLLQDFRFRSEIHGELNEQRSILTLMGAIALYERDDLVEAELWAIRALLEGPRVETFCILGDIAEDQGDIRRALDWYECACAVAPKPSEQRMARLVELRWGRRDGLRVALGLPPVGHPQAGANGTEPEQHADDAGGANRRSDGAADLEVAGAGES